MRLFFLRHGIAEDFKTSDFARELTGRGRRRLANAARVMRRLELRPAKIFSSPRARSLQTAEIVAAELGIPATVSERVNFGFEAADARALAAGLPAKSEVMFVGHNPDMSLVVSELTGTDLSMKKGGLARVDLAGGTMAAGELVWLIAPKVFDALHDAGLATPSAKLPDSAAALHRLIRERWSPVAFDSERRISRETLLSIMEAGRWAASSSNLQPWRFIVARRENEEEFSKALSVIKEGNLPWARRAAVLMIAVADSLRKPEAPNRHAGHDLGLAVSQMVLQALDHGVYAHQMGGFSPEKAREIYHIPAQFEAYTAIALGYRGGDLSHLDERSRQRDAAPRQRRPLSETVFSGSWARAADFLRAD